MSVHSEQIAAIQRQVMWNRLIAVVEEQAQTMIRTAFSTTVREAGDLSAGIFDLQGRMLAQAVTGTPGHVNSMMESVGHFLAKFPAASVTQASANVAAQRPIITIRLSPVAKRDTRSAPLCAGAASLVLSDRGNNAARPGLGSGRNHIGWGLWLDCHDGWIAAARSSGRPTAPSPWRISRP